MHRARARVVLEELHRDQRGDDGREHDPDEKERRQPEAQRPEQHADRRYEAADESAGGGAALYPIPHTVTIGDASPSFFRSCRTWTSTVRVSPANV